ncbi:MAG: 6-carboxytetrahydropterin synthase QueD [Bacteroidia bacterium]|nr:6-carboxytetrahydropterin synthase QueD [Bacteroidia bacterium]
MELTITKTFNFEAAHFLPNFPDGHKCRRLHGHSFKVKVSITGIPDPVTGVIMDFGEIKSQVKPLIEKLDHQSLNDLGAQWNDSLLINPTSENLSIWFFQQLIKVLPNLKSITIHETCTSQCTVSQ